MGLLVVAALIISLVCYVEASGEVDRATCVREHSDGRGIHGQINDRPSPPGPAECVVHASRQRTV